MFNKLAAVEHFIIAFTGAVPAEHAVVHSALASVVDALAAAFAVDAPARTPGQIFRVKFYADLLYGEKFSFVHHLIGVKLLAVRITGISAERFGFFTGIIARHDTHRPFRFEIDKSGRNFSVIEVFQRPLTQAASRNQAHGVCCATVNFNKGQQAFAVPDRVLDPQFLEAQHSHSHAQDLPRAHMAVVAGCQAEIFLKRFHRVAVLSALTFENYTISVPSGFPALWDLPRPLVESGRIAAGISGTW